MNEVPTSIRVGSCNMFVGFQSGKITLIQVVSPSIPSRRAVGRALVMSYNFQSCKYKYCQNSKTNKRRYWL